MKFACLLPLLLAAHVATAASGQPASPYAGQEDRAIKALSADEVAGLLAGKGMGFAKAAELNGYPGPMHVLELAGELGLSEQQLEATRALHARMKQQAQAIGARLVDAEAALEALFRNGNADAEGLEKALEEIAGLQADLRGAHLQAHIEQRALLTAEQTANYVRLRGYHGGHHHDAGGAHHGGGGHVH